MTTDQALDRLTSGVPLDDDDRVQIALLISAHAADRDELTKTINAMKNTIAKLVEDTYLLPKEPINA